MQLQSASDHQRVVKIDRFIRWQRLERLNQLPQSAERWYGPSQFAALPR
jgi:hypothetical protein